MSTFGTLSVIFDLDGTLVDSEPNYYEAGRRTLAEYGVPDLACWPIIAKASKPSSSPQGQIGE